MKKIILSIFLFGILFASSTVYAQDNTAKKESVEQCNNKDKSEKCSGKKVSCSDKSNKKECKKSAESKSCCTSEKKEKKS